MRKFLASHLIHLAHRIYRPTVTELADQFTELVFADGSALKLSRGWNN